jgi:Yip1-like protein
METQAGAVDTAVAEPEKRSFFAHLTGLFFSPAEEFRSIVKRPQVLWPLVALVLVSLLTWGYWLTRADMLQVMQIQAEMAGKPAPVIPAEAQGRVITFTRGVYIAIALLAPPLVVLIMAALYLLIFRFLKESEVTFRQSMSISAFASLVPTIVMYVLALITLFAKGDWNIMPPLAFRASVAVFLERAATAKWLYSLAESVDLFSAWTIWLLAAGYAAASRRTTGWAVGAVLGFWIFCVLIKVGMTALFS